MKIWIHQDEISGVYDICEFYEDAIGPDFVEAEVPDDFVKDFAEADLHWWHYQEILGDMWHSGAIKETL